VLEFLSLGSRFAGQIFSSVFLMVFGSSVPVSFFYGVQRRVLQFFVQFSSCPLWFHRTGARFDRCHRSSRVELAPPVFGPCLVPGWALSVAVAVFVPPCVAEAIWSAKDLLSAFMR
jgi:hypothetical protein